MIVSGLFNIMGKHNDVSLQIKIQYITMARARQVLPIVEPLAYWLRWGRVPCEESSGRAWLPLGCVVALEWLVDAKHGGVVWVLLHTSLPVL